MYLNFVRKRCMVLASQELTLWVCLYGCPCSLQQAFRMTMSWYHRKEVAIVNLHLPFKSLQSNSVRRSRQPLRILVWSMKRHSAKASFPPVRLQQIFLKVLMAIICFSQNLSSILLPTLLLKIEVSLLNCISAFSWIGPRGWWHATAFSAEALHSCPRSQYPHCQGCIQCAHWHFHNQTYKLGFEPAQSVDELINSVSPCIVCWANILMMYMFKDQAINAHSCQVGLWSGPTFGPQ